MAIKPSGSVALAVILTGALLGAANMLQRQRDHRYSLGTTRDDSLYVTSGATLRRLVGLTGGYHALAADLYWIRALQYYGGLRLRAETSGSAAEPEYQLLYPLLDLTTTLDPRFNIAYRFGSIFLAEPPPGGAGRADLAIRLLEKGLRELPDKWEYMLDIGFVHYWWTRDYKAAAAWFDRASQVPGAPSWLRRMAATTLTTGGDRRTSRQMWLSIRESAENAWVRNHAEWRLLQLQALDDLQALQQMLDRESATGPVGDWQTLIRAGRLRAIPSDPTGTPYDITSEGRVVLGSASPLRPLPDEPVRPAVPVP
jgi:hypothetical protein